MYKAGSEFKDDYSTESLNTAVWGRQFQSTMVWGEMKPFSVVFYIVGPDMI